MKIRIILYEFWLWTALIVTSSGSGSIGTIRVTTGTARTDLQKETTISNAVDLLASVHKGKCQGEAAQKLSTPFLINISRESLQSKCKKLPLRFRRKTEKLHEHDVEETLSPKSTSTLHLQIVNNERRQDSRRTRNNSISGTTSNLSLYITHFATNTSHPTKEPKPLSHYFNSCNSSKQCRNKRVITKWNLSFQNPTGKKADRLNKSGDQSNISFPNANSWRLLRHTRSSKSVPFPLAASVSESNQFDKRGDILPKSNFVPKHHYATNNTKVGTTTFTSSSKLTSNFPNARHIRSTGMAKSISTLFQSEGIAPPSSEISPRKFLPNNTLSACKSSQETSLEESVSLNETQSRNNFTSPSHQRMTHIETSSVDGETLGPNFTIITDRQRSSFCENTTDETHNGVDRREALVVEKGASMNPDQEPPWWITKEIPEKVARFKMKYPVKLWEAWGLYGDSYLHSINPHWLKFNPPNPAVHKILAALYGIFMVVGCGGNMLVIFMFARCRSLRTPPNYLIANLAVSDFLMMAKTPIFITNSLYYGPVLGALGCKIYGFVGGLTGTASIMTLASIALDRYYVIVHPLNPFKRTTSRRALLMIAGVWGYSGFFASLPLFGVNNYTAEGYLTSCSFDYLSEELADRSFVFIFFLAAWLVPISIITFSYVNIFRMVRATERMEIFDSGSAKKGESFKWRANEEKQSTDVKVAMLSISVISLWLLAWTPYAVVALLGIFGWKDPLTPLVSSAPALFCKTASCINPFVYSINHPRFQREFRSKFKVCFRYHQRRRVVIRQASFFSTATRGNSVNLGVFKRGTVSRTTSKTLNLQLETGDRDRDNKAQCTFVNEAAAVPSNSNDLSDGRPSINVIASQGEMSAKGLPKSGFQAHESNNETTGTEKCYISTGNVNTPDSDLTGDPKSDHIGNGSAVVDRKITWRMQRARSLPDELTVCNIDLQRRTTSTSISAESGNNVMGDEIVSY